MNLTQESRDLVSKHWGASNMAEKIEELARRYAESPAELLREVVAAELFLSAVAFEESAWRDDGYRTRACALTAAREWLEENPAGGSDEQLPASLRSCVDIAALANDHTFVQCCSPGMEHRAARRAAAVLRSPAAMGGTRDEVIEECARVCDARAAASAHAACREGSEKACDRERARASAERQCAVEIRALKSKPLAMTQPVVGTREWRDDLVGYEYMIECDGILWCRRKPEDPWTVCDSRAPLVNRLLAMTQPVEGAPSAEYLRKYSEAVIAEYERKRASPVSAEKRDVEDDDDDICEAYDVSWIAAPDGPTYEEHVAALRAVYDLGRKRRALTLLGAPAVAWPPSEEWIKLLSQAYHHEVSPDRAAETWKSVIKEMRAALEQVGPPPQAERSAIFDEKAIDEIVDDVLTKDQAEHLKLRGDVIRVRVKAALMHAKWKLAERSARGVTPTFEEVCAAWDKTDAEVQYGGNYGREIKSAGVAKRLRALMALYSSSPNTSSAPTEFVEAAVKLRDHLHSLSYSDCSGPTRAMLQADIARFDALASVDAQAPPSPSKPDVSEEFVEKARALRSNLRPHGHPQFKRGTAQGFPLAYDCELCDIEAAFDAADAALDKGVANSGETSQAPAPTAQPGYWSTKATLRTKHVDPSKAIVPSMEIVEEMIAKARPVSEERVREIAEESFDNPTGAFRSLSAIVIKLSEKITALDARVRAVEGRLSFGGFAVEPTPSSPKDAKCAGCRHAAHVGKCMHIEGYADAGDDNESANYCGCTPAAVEGREAKAQAFNVQGCGYCKTVTLTEAEHYEGCNCSCHERPASSPASDAKPTPPHAETAMADVPGWFPSCKEMREVWEKSTPISNPIGAMEALRFLIAARLPTVDVRALLEEFYTLRTRTAVEVTDREALDHMRRALRAQGVPTRKETQGG